MAASPESPERPAGPEAERERLLQIIARCYAALYEGDASDRDAAMLECREALSAAGYWDQPQPAFFAGV